ncbi:Triose-phosphate Transporter [Entophlyctis sp. JEL0112]|nr:Triose-phosphate Transporter [Entophlyctis sp. JEL0112]
MPTALCAVLDIGLSNASLQYISIPFYTIVKSVVPVWVLVFSIACGVERMSFAVFAVVSMMCLGVAFTVAGEIKFSTLGFTLIQVAAMSSGMRWALTQVLLRNHKLQNDAPKPQTSNNPLVTLKRLSPVMGLFFAILSLLFESGGESGWVYSPFFVDFSSALRTLLYIQFGAFLALCS